MGECVNVICWHVISPTTNQNLGVGVGIVIGVYLF